MSTVEVAVAIGNIRSNPRMSKADEQRATAALHDFADKVGALIVLGCEIAFPRMRRIWRRIFAGWDTAGDRPGCENVISVRVSDDGRTARRALVGRAFIRWLSSGVANVTPTRKTTARDVTVEGLRIRVISTHLVSRWQAYARVKAGSTWGLRNRIAKRSLRRLAKRVARAHAAGVNLVLIGGDFNTLEAIHIADGQVDVLGTTGKTGGNLGKMMGLYAFPADGVRVTVGMRKIHGPVATDHPFRAGALTVTY